MAIWSWSWNSLAAQLPPLLGRMYPTGHAGRSSPCRSWAAAAGALAEIFPLTDWKVCPSPRGQANRVLFAVLWVHQTKFFTPSLSASLPPLVALVAAAVQVVSL